MIEGKRGGARWEGTHPVHFMPVGSPIDARLLAMSEPAGNGCREWTAARTNGYGKVSWDGRMYLAHRLAYQIWVEPIPEGMTVDHVCFNPACINPAHLQLLTKGDNSSRQRKKFRPACAKGHAYEPDNLYLYVLNGRTIRRCRECMRARGRVADQRRRAKQAAAS